MTRFSIFLITACGILNLNAAPSLTTAAELAAVNRGETAEASDFVLTATLVRIGAVDATDSFFVTDRTGATSLRVPFDVRPARLAPGDRLRLTGTIDPIDPRGPDIVATNCQVLSSGSAPRAYDTTIRDAQSGAFDFQLIRLTAVVHDAFKDEIDRGFVFLVLMQDNETLYAALPSAIVGDREPDSFVGATISVTGLCDAYCGTSRRYRGRTINPTEATDLIVIDPPAKDVFAEPDIRELQLSSPDRLHAFGRHTARGRVIAAWNDFILIRRENGEFTTVITTQSARPQIGEMIVASGFPETDLYTITLTRASWKKIGDAATQIGIPQDVTARELIARTPDGEIFSPRYHGRAIRLDGIVRTLPGFGSETRLQIESGGTVFPVDVSANPALIDGLAIGCHAAFTGICVMDIERLRPNAPFPHIRGFTLVMRPRDSVEILARPSWWTPAHVWTVLGGLFVLLLAALGWIVTLQRVAERRGQQLLRGQIETVKTKLKVEERTRLAVELHDSLSQTLTGVSMEIAAADDLKGDAPAEMVTHLSRAGRVLKSCRDELRNCLWDLRNDALDEPKMTQAILKTLQPHLSDVRLDVRFDVPRARLSDNTAHAILRIIRELVVNALRHGKATAVEVAGDIDASGLRFSVTDNGRGFDPDDHPGVLQGHFGLQGIEERLRQLGGKMTIVSTPDTGTRITCFAPSHTTAI